MTGRFSTPACIFPTGYLPHPKSAIRLIFNTFKFLKIFISHTGCKNVCAIDYCNYIVFYKPIIQPYHDEKTSFTTQRRCDRRSWVLHDYPFRRSKHPTDRPKHSGCFGQQPSRPVNRKPALVLTRRRSMVSECHLPRRHPFDNRLQRLPDPRHPSRLSLWILQNPDEPQLGDNRPTNRIDRTPLGRRLQLYFLICDSIGRRPIPPGCLPVNGETTVSPF